MFNIHKIKNNVNIKYINLDLMEISIVAISLCNMNYK